MHRLIDMTFADNMSKTNNIQSALTQFTMKEILEYSDAMFDNI